MVILGEVKIGEDNWIGPHAVIGAPPEHRSFHAGVTLQPMSGKIVIGSRNVIHEHVAIQAPTGAITSLNDDCFIMHGVHVAHEVRLAQWATIAPGTVLGGHSTVGYRATLGIGVAVHQHRCIGPLAMVGMNSTVIKDVQPFSLLAGSPARFLKANLISLESGGIPLGSWTQFINQPLEHWVMSEVPDEVSEILKG